MEAVIQCCHRVLSEGRFFVLNSSPILIPRSQRNKSSQRKAIPFDLHRVVMGAGFDFIDDIIWVKQTASCCHRGRNFERIRKPLLYKAIPVTEYVMVYRKQTDKLLDWNIRYTHDCCSRSLIPDGYEKTNVWHISYLIPLWRLTRLVLFAAGFIGIELLSLQFLSARHSGIFEIYSSKRICFNFFRRFSQSGMQVDNRE
jgi:hypothetical protein